MFMPAQTYRLDFADTHTVALDLPRPNVVLPRETADAGELLASADAVDLHLLRLVACAAAATLLLALATSLSV